MPSFAGIDWHCNIQVDHNLITAGDMPHFFMDMYEECHGPPQLFKLDKYGIVLVTYQPDFMASFSSFFFKIHTSLLLQV